MDPEAEHESLDRFELFTKQLLANCGLELRKIPEGDLPMPDFAVFAGERQVAVLEVKSMKSTARAMSVEEMALFEASKTPLTPEGGLKRMEVIWIEPRAERHRLTFYPRMPSGRAFRNGYFRSGG